MPDTTPEEQERQARAALALQAHHPPDVGRLVRALTQQALYAQALSLALDFFRGARTGVQAQVLHDLTNDIVTSCSQLGLPTVAMEFVERYRATFATPQAGPVPHAWPGRWLAWLGETQAAADSHAAALRRFPGDPFLRVELGTCQMAMGDTAGIENLREFSLPAFWQAHYRKSVVGPFDRMWRGESLQGQSLLVLRHGGVGDAIQFARYARILRELGAREVAFCLPHGEIAGVLASAEGISVIRPGTPVDPSAFDRWTSTFGLFLHMFREHGFGGTAPYLRAPEDAWADALVGQVRARAAGRRCIALWWHSDAQNGLIKSVPLQDLLPLFGLPEVHWVVLQRGVGLREFERSGLHRADGHFTVVPETASFDQQARILQEIDGIVTIDSFASHLAGALGVRSWMLAGRVLDWRYMNAQAHAPMYADARICRQPRLGDWREAVAKVCAELAA